MALTTVGMIILAALVIMALGLAALSLTPRAGGQFSNALALIPVALVAAIGLAMLLGYKLPTGELTTYVPVAVGLVTALMARSLGYGLLAGLIVAATLI